MNAHIDGEADLFTVLSRLSGSYAKLAGVPMPLANIPLRFSGNGTALVSAFGNSCE